MTTNPHRHPHVCLRACVRAYLVQGRGGGERPLEGVHHDGHLYLFKGFGVVKSDGRAVRAPLDLPIHPPTTVSIAPNVYGRTLPLLYSSAVGALGPVNLGGKRRPICFWVGNGFGVWSERRAYTQRNNDGQTHAKDWVRVPHIRIAHIKKAPKPPTTPRAYLERVFHGHALLQALEPLGVDRRRVLVVRRVLCCVLED